nr:hypothetical protein [Tanacetum cinerariifolium]
MLCIKFTYLTTSPHSSSSHSITHSPLNSSLIFSLMLASSKTPCDYLRKHRRAILEPWRQHHNLPSSPPSPLPHRNPPTSSITTNSLSSSSPPQNPTQNHIVHDLNEISHLLNILDINLQQAIEATNPSPPTSPCIPPPTLDQVNFDLRLCHCCLQTQDRFDILRYDLNRTKSIIIGPSTAILEPWIQHHNLPSSPPSPLPHRNPPTSSITTNSLSSSLPPQNQTQNHIVHDLNEISHLLNILDINLQQAIEATNPSPPTSPCIPLPTLDQVNFDLRLCHCCLQTQDLFDILRYDLNRTKSIIIGPST